MKDIFLLTGSNLGNSQQLLASAAHAMQKHVGVLQAASAVYRTAAWGNTQQPDYLNQVLWLKTSLAAADVLPLIWETEQQLGRVRAEKWGARYMDIDILLYGHDIINTSNLQVPHPYLQVRRFALTPLAQIAGQWMHPVYKRTIAELLDTLTDDLTVTPL